jgi:tetratricopeptide (TPR) repeat protein
MSALATAGWLATSAAAAEPCHLSKYFDLPVDMEGRAAIVSTKIDGQEARFEVDTGAFFSTLTAEAADRLKLRTVPTSNVLIVEGIGGSAGATVGEASDFNFAGVPLKHVQFVVGGRDYYPDTVGLLGENLLSWADVEYDFAHGVMRFIKVEGCGDKPLAYWSRGNYGVIPIDAYNPPESAHIKGTVKINGRSVRVMFDTGSSVSVLTRRGAERAGVNMDGPDVKSAGLSSGIGRGVVETWTVPIDSFAIADEQIKSTRLTVVDKMSFADVDMLLGMDFFLSHRVLVSRSQKKLYFSYNGGPVFRLDEPTPPALSREAGAPAAASDKPADADALGRQGEALMSRRDFVEALRAFDQAVALEPKAPQRYMDRAGAHRAMGKIDLARADLDRALELKPDFTPALLARGDLALGAKDVVRAEADFAAALKAAPTGGDVQLQVAEIYDLHHRWAEAIPHYDAWIAANPKDGRLWDVLTNRCAARGMVGEDLDKALEDCNAALRKGPRNSAVLDSRGLVYLRLGRLKEAIADYDAALKLQPKLAWSLYGRGLAKRRLGMKAEGDADIKAALALAPRLEAEAKEIGLSDSEPAKAEAMPKT